MATKKVMDQFANIAAISVTESAANTQTSTKFSFPFSIMDKMALLISRIEYWFEGYALFNSGDDRTILALTCNSTVTSIVNQADPLIVDSARLGRVDYGAAATGLLRQEPFVKDFSSLPGSGILVAPNPLYAMIQSTGASGASSGSIKLFYTYMELSSDEYWQLVESRRIISS